MRAEWRHATRSARAAETLLAQGFREDAVSRAYYAVMHAAKAALLTHDAVPISHVAIRRLFGQLLVKPGDVEKEWAEVLARETSMSVAEVSDPNGANRRELFSVRLFVPVGSPEHLTPPIVYGEDPGIGTVRGLPAPDLRSDGTLYQATVHGEHLFFRLKP